MTPQEVKNDITTAKEREDHQPSVSTTFYYLSDSASRELPKFQYNGKDLSLTYKYFLSPLAEWCVSTLTPRSIAPNTITLSGLLFMIGSYLAMWYHVPMLLQHENSDDEDAPIPRWVFLLNCCSILIYQTLDNMDGKQARRVGASSPLGLLFDHGCDAINSVFGSANWMVAMYLSNTSADLWLCFSMLMGPYGLFFIGTWEEYYTGQLIMPIFNGPNEGLLGAATMSFFSYCYGPMYWQSYSWWNTSFGTFFTAMAPLRNADILVLCSSIGFCQEIGLKLTRVIGRYGSKAALNLLPFCTLVTCSVVVGRADPQVWLDVPRASLHLCAFLFVEMTTELMLRHMTKQVYQPFRWILFPLVVFSMLVGTETWPHNSLNMSDFLLIYASSAGVYLLMKTVHIIHEICCVLNIWCFDIVTSR